MTQHRYTSRSRSATRRGDSDGNVGDDASGISQLAGFAGLFTGAGALVALLLFLPLPVYFQEKGQNRAASVRTSYYVVGAIAFVVSFLVFFSLKGLPGEEGKTLSSLWKMPYNENTGTDEVGNVHITLTPPPSYLSLVKQALKLGITDSNIAIGYIGGFVARSSSVAISAFIPLFVNDYFVRNKLCTSNPNDLTDIKEHCQRAYKLASALTGIAETAALISAPLFGWVGGKVSKGQSEWPLLFAAVVGIAGYVSFGLLRNPDPFHKSKEGGRWAILAVIGIGISQIGSIVCSLSLLGRGINHVGPNTSPSARRGLSETTGLEGNDSTDTSVEAAPLLAHANAPSRHGDDASHRKDRTYLKGTIAGIYSFFGGAGILILTKAGGLLFDSWAPGAPFFLMAIFNAIMLIAVVFVAGGKLVIRQTASYGPKGVARDD